MTPLSILFVAPYPPSLIHVRTYNLIKALAHRGHRITLLYLLPPGESTSPDGITKDCVASMGVPLSRRQTLLNGLRALPTRRPFQAAYGMSPQMVARIRQTLAAHSFDVAHVEHLRAAEVGRRISGVPVVFDSVDSISLLFDRLRSSAPTLKSRLMAWLDLARTRHYEARLLEYFSRVVITSPHDRDALVALSSAPRADERISVVANGVDLEYFSPLSMPRDPKTVVFSGKMSYHANIAAGLDLATKIMPAVWQKIPDAKLIIAGKDPSPQLMALGSDARITVTGTVPDLRPYLARATVAVSPIRYGVGIQNKVLEAMAMGTPVVSTRQAVSALAVSIGRDILVGDSPEEIADGIISLIENPQQQASIGAAGRDFVVQHHSWYAAAETLETVYRAAMADQRASTA